MHTAWGPTQGLQNGGDFSTLGGLPGARHRPGRTKEIKIGVNAPTGAGPSRRAAASPVRGHDVEGVRTIDLMEVLGLAHLSTDRTGQVA